MDDQIFADGISTISVIGGTVRIDFTAYSPTQVDASGQPTAVFRQRIIMGLEAFVRTAEKIHEAGLRLTQRSATEPVGNHSDAPSAKSQNAVEAPAAAPAQEPEVEPAPARTAMKPPFP